MDPFSGERLPSTEIRRNADGTWPDLPCETPPTEKDKVRVRKLLQKINRITRKTGGWMCGKTRHSKPMEWNQAKVVQGQLMAVRSFPQLNLTSLYIRLPRHMSVAVGKGVVLRIDGQQISNAFVDGSINEHRVLPVSFPSTPSNVNAVPSSTKKNRKVSISGL